MTDDMDYPVVSEVYTVPETAKALGKTVLTVKRWIKDGMLPPPVLADTVNGYRHYSRGELEIVCDLLASYAKDYSYIVGTNNPFVHSVWQRLEAHRRRNI